MGDFRIPFVANDVFYWSLADDYLSDIGFPYPPTTRQPSKTPRPAGKSSLKLNYFRPAVNFSCLKNIWYEPIRELGWFGEFPGYYNQSGMTAPQMVAPGMGMPMVYPGQQMYYQQPGQAIIVQPGVHGAPPTVTTQPL
jgi:hypothetical protein